MSTIFLKKKEIYCLFSVIFETFIKIDSWLDTGNVSSTPPIAWELRNCNYWTNMEIKTFWKIRIENHKTYTKQTKLYSEMHNFKIVISMSWPQKIWFKKEDWRVIWKMLYILLTKNSEKSCNKVVRDHRYHKEGTKNLQTLRNKRRRLIGERPCVLRWKAKHCKDGSLSKLNGFF